MFSSPTPLAVLISGGGRTLVNLQHEIDAGRLDVRVSLVISSSPRAGGNERARGLGLPLEVVARGGFVSDAAFGEAVFGHIARAGAELVCLAGFLKFLPVPEGWLGRVINIHPALLPRHGGPGMYGHYVHEAVLAAGDPVSGCTVHFATNEYDRGPIILQRECAVDPADTAETLAARVFGEECIAYPEAIRMLQRGEAGYGQAPSSALNPADLRDRVGRVPSGGTS